VTQQLAQLYKFLARNWNAFLAATSLIGVAIFGLMPPLSKYVPAFVFLGANAIVWTLIEIKHDLGKRDSVEKAFPNMRIARPRIMKVILDELKHTHPERPLTITLIGGRIRSMSDILRELADEMQSNRVPGHAAVRLYCLDPAYIASRTLPGQITPDQQRPRNASYGAIIANFKAELESRSFAANPRTSLRIEVVLYSEDPQRYAFIVGDSSIFWGPYTWSVEASDFVGPENACFEVQRTNSSYVPIRSWLESRVSLYDLEYSAAKTVSTV
jgi:hypothetical protein